MASRTRPPISFGRKLSAGAAMAGAGGVVLWHALHGWWGVEWWLVAVGGAITAAGVGLTRRSLVSQVLSRGLAWLVFVPTLAATTFRVANGHAVLFSEAALAAGTGLALLLSRPLLHSDEARAAFAPKAFRRWLLAGSIVTSAAGFVAGGLALDVARHSLSNAITMAVLAASYFASAIAVVRMRAWGILLGGLTSVLLIASGLAMQHEAFAIFVAGAAPALLFYVLPVLLARWGGSETALTLRAADRVADEEDASYVKTMHYRIATETESLEVEADREPVSVPSAALRS